MQLKLISSRSESSDTKSFIFESNPLVSWVAGQFIHIVLPHTEVDERGDNRWFTISAAPSEGHLMITTRFNAQKSSSFKQALAALEVGDEVASDLPGGRFVLVDTAREYIFIAGGIGITPFRSMLVEAAAQNVALNVTLLYANRDENIPFRAELDALALKNNNLKIDYVVNPRVIDSGLLESTLQTAHDPLIFISGPEPMVKAMEAQLGGLGVAPANMSSDYFPGYDAS